MAEKTGRKARLKSLSLQYMYDKDGQRRLDITLLADGGGDITFWDGAGDDKARIRIGAASKLPGIALFGNGERATAWLLNDDGRASLMFMGKDGNERASIGVNAADEPLIWWHEAGDSPAPGPNIDLEEKPASIPGKSGEG